MKRIIVIGCQRSGTNIAAKCIAHDNGLKLYNERDLGYSSCSITNGSKDLLIEFMNNTDEFVLQAPSLNAYCETVNSWLDEPVFFYWVNRDTNEIKASRKRVNWIGEQTEVEKYKKFDWLLENVHCRDSIDMAKQVFHRYQKNLIPHIVTHYEAFSNHPLWKNERSNLNVGET